MRRCLKKMFFKLADGTFLYGNYAKRLMIKEGFREDKLFMLHNSLDYDKQLALRKCLVQSDVYRRHFGDEGKNLIFIGRLTTMKRLNLLIAALNLLNGGEGGI